MISWNHYNVQLRLHVVRGWWVTVGSPRLHLWRGRVEETQLTGILLASVVRRARNCSSGQRCCLLGPLPLSAIWSHKSRPILCIRIETIQSPVHRTDLHINVCLSRLFSHHDAVCISYGIAPNHQVKRQWNVIISSLDGSVCLNSPPGHCIDCINQGKISHLYFLSS